MVTDLSNGSTGPEDNVLIACSNGVILDDNGPMIVTINVD